MASKTKQRGEFKSRRQEIDPPVLGPPRKARQDYTARPCLKNEKKKKKNQEAAGKWCLMRHYTLYIGQCLPGHEIYVVAHRLF